MVPLLEVPSGILADRWARRGVLIGASIALASCALIGGLSTDVPTYVLSALMLGVIFAMRSGTMDSIVYDTVLEETGHSDEFEHSIGRVRLTESIALVSGALVGGWTAGLCHLAVRCRDGSTDGCHELQRFARDGHQVAHLDDRHDVHLEPGPEDGHVVGDGADVVCRDDRESAPGVGAAEELLERDLLGRGPLAEHLKGAGRLGLSRCSAWLPTR